MISKEVRKEIGLPITKDIIYYRHVVGSEYEKYDVSDIHIVNRYLSGSFSLRITLLESLLNELREVNILSDFLIHMQKPSFIRDMTEVEYE